MIRSLVLRFSDYEADSIARHQEIIKSNGCVLWGWWKKYQEPIQLDVLKTIEKLCPIRIGLANTMTDEYYVAQCKRIFIDPSGSQIPTPDSSLTPTYYGESTLPAWFELSSIERLEYAEFDIEFGGFPKGSTTLFASIQSHFGDRSLEVPAISDIETIKTKGASILHLSDLHFGDDHGFVKEKGEDPVTDYPLEDIIFKGIQSHKNIHIGMIVISGDFISRGDAKGFDHAHKFLNNLLNLLHLRKEHVVMVPGNHDIPVDIDEQPTIDYEFAQQYLNFTRAFFGKDITETNNIYSFISPDNWHINFLALNSCRPRRKEVMDYGFIGKDYYEKLLQRIIKINENKNKNELLESRVLNFAVFHHHLLPGELVIRPELKPEPRPVSMTLDAGEIVTKLQNSAFHYVLHGHQHIPFIGSTSRIYSVSNRHLESNSPLIIIGMGSSGGKSERLGDEMRMNAFGIYTPKDEGLHIIMDEYNHVVAPRTLLDLMIPFK